jgi:hypothetical protein
MPWLPEVLDNCQAYCDINGVRAEREIAGLEINIVVI